MTRDASYLAVDLGASGGRAILVRFDGRRFQATEVHRFENRSLQTSEGLFWDAPRLFNDIKSGLRLCSGQGLRLDAIGIDTWGVDFALLAAGGDLLAAPRHYRDPRNVPAFEQALRRVPRERIYNSTGIQFMPLNTLYQLHAEANAPARLLDTAQRLLFMPDLFNFWLTGEAQTERTIASTSQALNARSGEWDDELLTALDIPPRIMPPIRPTGSVGGRLLQQVAEDTGQSDLPIVLTASHDTAAAVVAVPAEGGEWAFISSGTWSLVGVELAAPLINRQSQAANFTNEAGMAGTTRFLKNVPGLWLLQECRRCWEEAGRSLSYAEIAALAERAEPLRSLIVPDDPRFAAPADMPGRIREACRELGQPEPVDEGALARCVLDSLALRYDQVLRDIVALTGRKITTVHVVGGGSRNELLNQLVAGAAERVIVAGPAEATALGNAAVQAIALGHLADLGAARRTMAASVDQRTYEPPTGSAERRAWAAARERFAKLTASTTA
ncbi:MAG TPA: rhamnulokinase family protein [Phycisphaerae bacterium]|nr:rhamnulokinase family protein [Phycisphaerae bacterium]HNU44272.1 rhamnulokinase family protein [Phycisphaerae bacterium]